MTLPASDPIATLRGKLRDRFAPGEAVLLSSGTAALTLALQIRNSGNTEACALPAYGCYDLATAAIGAGRRVRLYDVDPATLAPDEESFRRVLAEGVNTVVLVHQFGVPVDVERFGTLARSAGALVVEDAAQAFGGRLRREALGGLGDVSILSFGRGKGLTGGSGGALIQLALEDGRRVLEPTSPSSGPTELLRLFAQRLLSDPSVYSLAARAPLLGLGRTHYRPPSPSEGISPRAAHAVVSNWELALREVDDRNGRAGRYHASLRARGVSTIGVLADSTPSWLRYPVVASPKTRVEPTLGVMRGYPLALSALAALQPNLIGGRPTPGAVHLAQHLITLPTHSLVTATDEAAITTWVLAALGQ